MSRVGNWLFCTLVASTLFVGCETKPKTLYKSLGLVPVGGKISLDGQPLANAVVTFDDAVDGTFSFAQTDAGGNYKLRFDSEVMGAKPGRKIVRISTTRKILGLNSLEGEGGTPDEGANRGEGDEQETRPEQQKELVPDKYYKKSKLTADVTSSNTTFNFELVSVAASGP